MADFEDGKDETALRTIGEVSEALDIKPHVLRYWEQQFSLLKPLKRSGGRRYYRPEDVAMVEEIDRLVNEEGYTLKGAESVLKAKGKGANSEESAAPEFDTPTKGTRGDAAETVRQLKSIRNRLAAAIES